MQPADHDALASSGGVLRVGAEGLAAPIYLLAVDGTFVALSPVCTHLGCTVEVQGERLVCPCHGSTYDRRGRVLRGPAERALHSFPIRVEADGTLLIDVSGG